MTDLVRELFDEEEPDVDLYAEEDDDDDSAEDVVYESGHPKCRTCKDPNYSLDSDRCISCRALI